MGVRREIFWSISILPMIFADWWAEWSDVFYASDASGDQNAGYGVTYASLGREFAAEHGRRSEKWRYQVEDAICARRRALGVRLDPDSDARDPATLECLSSDTSEKEAVDCFPQIPMKLV